MITQINFGEISGNVYLIKNKCSFVLVDTGLKSKRNAMVKKLKELGCKKLGMKYNIREIAFDRWDAVQMVQNLEGMGFTVVPFVRSSRICRHRQKN